MGSGCVNTTLNAGRSKNSVAQTTEVTGYLQPRFIDVHTGREVQAS